MIKINKKMLNGNGKRMLGVGITTDEQVNYYGWGNPKKPLKIVVMKGYIDDWAIYLESMKQDMTYDQVRDYGNKITCLKKVKLLVDCDKEVLERYRK